MCLIDAIQTKIPRRPLLNPEGVGYKVMELTTEGTLKSLLVRDIRWIIGEWQEARNLEGLTTNNPTWSLIPDPWGIYVLVRREDAAKIAGMIPDRERANPASRYVVCEVQYQEGIEQGTTWGFSSEQYHTVVVRKARVLRVLED